MVFAICLSQNLLFLKPYSSNVDATLQIKCCSQSQSKSITSNIETKKRCLRCNTLYSDQHNSPASCSFHGHTNGFGKVDDSSFDCWKGSNCHVSDCGKNV
uniref:Uncharacterized protein LOC101490445 isoform X2 n=1 Tax=Cicer arietinum TaxID=3827 RepID=A0A1S2YWD1_CICAR|nr:uncharacterized protein LOC101490445 isoform X2 [Cicer arietinum]